jgi:uroporphyrin-III C-methyltransferase/precorrin-2 dehydrogenase/sirohydrochlorin ferrochelatase
MRYFPIFLDLQSQQAVIVGGGIEALNKARLLAKTEAAVTIVAAELHPDLQVLAESGKVRWIREAFRPEFLDGSAIV